MERVIIHRAYFISRHWFFFKLVDSETKENHRKYFNCFYSLTLKFLRGVKFHFQIIIWKAKIFVHVLVPVFAA